MKKQISTTISVLVLVFTFSASFAYAWVAPSQTSSITAPALGFAVPTVNIDCPFGVFSAQRDQCRYPQIKRGPMLTESFFKAGTAFSWDTDGSVVSEDLLLSPLGLFYKIFVPGTSGQLLVRNYENTNLSYTAPLAIDMYLRGGGAPSGPTSGTTLPQGHEAIDMLADTNFCNTKNSISTSTPAIQFWSTKNNTEADVLAKGIQLRGGNPQPGMILVSTDPYGNAVWATPKLETNGTISFIYNSPSPVVDGQTVCP